MRWVRRSSRSSSARSAGRRPSGSPWVSSRSISSAQRLRLLRLRPAERDAARQAVPHGAGQGEVGGRAADRVAGAVPRRIGALDQPALRHLRQFEVVEEEVEEFLAAEDEAELVLARAVRAALAAAAPAAARRTRDLVAGAVFLVARQHMVADAAVAVVEGRLPDAVQRDRHLATLVGAADAALGGGVAHRVLHQRLGAAQEALPVGKAASARVEASVEDLHSRLSRKGSGPLSLPASPACTTPPGAAPGVRCSRAPSCGTRTPCASSRSRRPSWSRRRSPAAGPRPG